MSNTVKERLADELQKAKSEGSLRTGRIQEIFKAAIAQTVAELKGGAVEIHSIAHETVGVVVDQVKEQGQKVKTDLTASIEGLIEGNLQPLANRVDSDPDSPVETSAQLQSPAVEAATDTDGALLVLENQPASDSKTFQSLFAAALRAIRQRQEWTGLQERFQKLQATLADLDLKLTERYGDRYLTVKHQVQQQRDQAQSWYRQAKTKVEAGESHPVQQTQAEFEKKASEIGATVAHKEAEIKQQIKEVLHNAFQR